MIGRGRGEWYRLNGAFHADPDGREPARIVGMLVVSRRDARILRRFADDIGAAPDLKVDFTEGKGWHRRNVRIRVTGPNFAVRVANTQLRALFGLGDQSQ